MHRAFDKLGVGDSSLAFHSELLFWHHVIAVLVAAFVAITLVGCAQSPSGDGAPEDSASLNEGVSGSESASSEEASSSGEGISASESLSAGESSSTNENSNSPFAYSELLDAPAKKAIPADLKNKVQALIDSSGMEVEVAFVDLSDSGEAFDINGDKPAVAASIIKLAVLAEVLEQADHGDLSLNDTCTVQPGDIVGGSGVIQSKGAGISLTVDQLVEYMIADSDNVAANILINKVGMDKVNTCAQRLGLNETSLNRLMLDQAAVDAGVENYTSANDVSSLLVSIYRGKLVSDKMSNRALEALKHQNIEGGIAQGIPSGVTVAYKTGSLVGAENDAAIVFGARPYVLVVMTAGYAGGSKELIGNISYEVWAHQAQSANGTADAGSEDDEANKD